MFAIASTTVPGAGEPESQSKTRPTIPYRGMLEPVLKTYDRVTLLTLPRRSARPGSSVMRYVVLGLNPPRGSMVIVSRCHSTFVAPVRGETSTTASSPIGPPRSDKHTPQLQ